MLHLPLKYLSNIMQFLNVCTHALPWVNGICNPSSIPQSSLSLKVMCFSITSVKEAGSRKVWWLLAPLSFGSASRNTVEVILPVVLSHNEDTKINKKLSSVLPSLISFICHYKGRSWSLRFWRTPDHNLSHLKVLFRLSPQRLFIGFSVTTCQSKHWLLFLLVISPASYTKKQIY